MTPRVCVYVYACSCVCVCIHLCKQRRAGEAKLAQTHTHAYANTAFVILTLVPAAVVLNKQLKTKGRIVEQTNKKKGECREVKKEN